MSALVTVVVPVYNVERYLDRCVQSIVNQTYTNLEIILVDDGSPDRCPEMCDEWARKDPRIRVIHKQNAGLGFARNTGIENATGDYICFVDSDDYIDHAMVGECCELAESEQADLVCFGHYNVQPNGQVTGSHIPAAPKTIYEGEEVRKKLIPKMVAYDAKTGENWDMILSACTFMISMRRVREAEWRFVSEREIISEDFYSMLALFQYVRKVMIHAKPYYFYVVNPASLSRTYRRGRWEKLKRLAQAMNELGRKMNCNIETEVATMILGQLMAVLRQVVASAEKRTAKMEIIKEILWDPFLQKMLCENDFSGDNATKRLLYRAMRKKAVTACYFLAAARNLKG